MAQLNEEILDSIDPDGAIPDPEMAGHKSRSEYATASALPPPSASLFAPCALPCSQALNRRQLLVARSQPVPLLTVVCALPECCLHISSRCLHISSPLSAFVKSDALSLLHSDFCSRRAFSAVRCALCPPVRCSLTAISLPSGLCPCVRSRSVSISVYVSLSHPCAAWPCTRVRPSSDAWPCASVVLIGRVLVDQMSQVLNYTSRVDHLTSNWTVSNPHAHSPLPCPLSCPLPLPLSRPDPAPKPNPLPSSVVLLQHCHC